jgi:hypothetical protein
MISGTERNFDKATLSAAQIIRPHEEPQSWNIPPEWNEGSWLMAQLEHNGFKNKVSVRPVDSCMEAESFDELIENFLLGKDMFFKGYSEEELAKLAIVLKDEVRKLNTFEETDEGAKIGMKAWLAIAIK